MCIREVTTFAYAKINLSLAIIGAREDGYHELQTIMQTISLCDTVQILRNGKDILCNCGELSGSKNLAYRVTEHFLKKLGINEGIEITIHKNIPLQAGLAGGSSDAAATLRGLNKLYGNPFSYEELKEIADIYGSDISFCLKGGTQWVTGRGEILEELPAIPEINLVIAKPLQGVNTGEAFRRFDRTGKTSLLDKSLWEEAIIDNSIEKIAKLMRNDLEEVSTEIVPAIREIKRELLEAGCSIALMSGSGSSVFGLAKDAKHASNIASHLRSKGYTQVWEAKTVSKISEQ